MTVTERRIDILVVDDDEIDRESVRRLLGPNFRMSEASSAGEALSAIAAAPPDCILLDYRLPDMDGIEMLPDITQRSIPVIILTGVESSEIIVRSMQRGAQDYLVKNQLTPIALEHAISSAIERTRLQEDIKEKNRQLRELASALAVAEQRERRRISHILHDGVQQMLYGIQMRSQMLKSDLEAEPGQVLHLQAIQSLVQQAILTTRSLAVELSPLMLYSDGLAAALEWLAVHMQETYNLHVDLDLQADFHGSEDIRYLLFQLVRELLFNVVKHAGVNDAQLCLSTQDGCLSISVTDTGRGFSPEAYAQAENSNGGFGLYSARERLALFGGELEIITQPGAGVRATILAPKNPEMPTRRKSRDTHDL